MQDLEEEEEEEEDLEEEEEEGANRGLRLVGGMASGEHSCLSSGILLFSSAGGVNEEREGGSRVEEAF